MGGVPSGGAKGTPPMHNQRLPHHKLHAYDVALRLLEAVRSAKIRDCHLRDQAMRTAKSACLNAAEGAGRVSRADKARAFAIARAEAGEAAAASRSRLRRGMLTAVRSRRCSCTRIISSR